MFAYYFTYFTTGVLCVCFTPGYAGHAREPDVPEYNATLAALSACLSGASSDAPTLSSTHPHLAECVVTLKVSSDA